MQRIRVVSSNISSVGYNEDSQTLEVEFKSGKIYQYFNVTQEVYNELIQASSLGRYFNSNIRNTYQFSEV